MPPILFRCGSEMADSRQFSLKSAGRWRVAAASRAFVAPAEHATVAVPLRDDIGTTFNLRNESGTKHARIADSAAVQIRSRPYLEPERASPTRSGAGVRISGAICSPDLNAQPSRPTPQESRQLQIIWSTRRASAPRLRRTASPAAPPDRSAWALGRGSAPARACRRSARTRPPCPSAWRCT